LVDLKVVYLVVVKVAKKAFLTAEKLAGLRVASLVYAKAVD